MLTRKIFGWLRLLTAAICITALTHRMIWGMGSQTLASDNFFAYLTIQSNTAFAVVAIVAGIIALRQDEDPAWMTTARALVLSWTITAGLAFALIVWQAGLRGIPITVPWSDVMLHFIIPAWTIVAWIFGPGRRAASWRVVPFVLLYPIVWGVFTIWRGAVIGWYPYYFLDPRQVSGLLEMAITSAIALAIFALVASGLVVLSRVHPTVEGVSHAIWRKLPRKRADAARSGVRKLPPPLGA
ncbi:Integral membrane protein [Microbacterium esteraromaticum]|uniref:Integral membrane protein n=1 Tax=Microbacterium esteraromaticum TaxID=57043 RepID=A0A1R4KPQ0_9MICO|nr:Pr6Pr family membrane protein [Microbacterium esteraromaticum]SJN46351.1 Integral membrane protein [Microbacterium esteraromaticum]